MKCTEKELRRVALRGTNIIYDIHKQHFYKKKNNSIKGEISIDGFSYEYRCYGKENFIINKIIRKDNDIIWGMNSFGRMIDKAVPKEFYDFYANKFGCMFIDFRFQENFHYKSYLKINDLTEELESIFKYEGDLFDFVGTDEVYYNDKLCFLNNFHGGVLANSCLRHN